jgi:hypothetical protein
MAATVSGAPFEGDMLEMLVPGSEEPAGNPGSVVAAATGVEEGRVGVAARAKSPWGVAQGGVRSGRSFFFGPLLMAKYTTPRTPANSTMTTKFLSELMIVLPDESLDFAIYYGRPVRPRGNR